MFTLHTPRLLIRDWLEQDQPDEVLAAMFQDPRYAQFIFDRPGAEIRADTPAKAQQLREACMSHVGANYAVVLKDPTGGEARIIGQCGIFPACRPTERVIGFGVEVASWGHGYATETARALIRHCFALPTDEVTAVMADTHIANHAAQRVMLRCGMTRWADTSAAPGRAHYIIRRQTELQ
jgi:RimJ/RimL family protein N-acetyltransferase